DSVFDGDIWYSQKINGRWQPPKSMPYGINTPQGEDEPNVTADGQTVYYQSWNSLWQRTGGPYYKARHTGGKSWSRPEGLGGGITEFFRTTPATDGMSISSDEKTFIVAAGRDYDAPMDIYMSKKSSYGWTYCKKLPISTTRDDRSVFLAADGKTIYFASNGYKGFGGLDIYKTTLNSDGTVGEIINVGAPFNTPADDYGLILTGDGNEAYFVRDGDIYFADLKEADERIKPEIPTYTHTLKGTVRDSNSWVGLSAEIILLDARTKRIIAKENTTKNGSYEISIPNKARVYDQIVICDGYNKTRSRVSFEVRGYNETKTNHFLLVREEPLIAEHNQPEEKQDPEPQKEEQDPEPKKKEDNIVITQIEPPKETKDQKPNIDETTPEIIEDIDPYSFEGIAENNLILLLDVSASMRKPEKLPLLKDSFNKLLEHMRPEDRISVIVYSGDAKVVLDGVSAANRSMISEAIEGLRSGGSTKGKNALKRAYKLASDNYISGGNNRIIMATDGYFDVDDLFGIAEKNASGNVFLTVFSFGKLSDTKIEELQSLAQRGGGNYAGITPTNVDRALLKEAKAVRH
ncbi:MAG: VWA domain-containing protein, partial [Bacteroidetes bacterium]|nr:VWA domain-containing protein [Bacteroidota bacterium]